MADILRNIGAQMANVMFNLAQRPGEALKPEVAAVMADLRKQWDAAVRAVPPSPSTAPEVKPWQDRVTGHMVSEYPDLMKAEIADLRAALASRPAEVDDEGLPPLPTSAWRTMDIGLGNTQYFTAEQYRQGQRDAVAAYRVAKEFCDKNCLSYRREPGCSMGKLCVSES